MIMQSALIFNLIVISVLTAYWFRDRKQAIMALRIAYEYLKKILPLITIILLILVMTKSLFSEDYILREMTEITGLKGYLFAAFLGAIVHIPMFIAFPIGGNLLDAGINAGFIAVLVTSLVMVHTFSIPMEWKEMGVKYTLVRNGLALVFAVIIGILVGWLY